MRLGTLVAVALAFGLLAFLWLRRSEGLRQDTLHVYDHPILAELHVERVATVRIDHLERASQLRLERDRQGTWLLSDPIAYPAEGALVEKLLGILARERGTLVEHPALAELGLDPPRAVVELDELDEGGARTTRRVEIGADDVDPRLACVRVPGHPATPAGESAAVLRVTRALVNTLERDTDGWRDTRLGPLAAAGVRRFVRRGAEPLDAVLEDGEWLTSDTGIRLDPSAIDLLVRCATELRVRAFVDDAPFSLARYGLEAPEFELELFDERDSSIVLRFGRGPGGRCFAMRGDLPNVFGLEPSDVGLLQRPEEALWDQTLVRLLRRQLLAVELSGPAGEIRLERSGTAWTVRTEGKGFPADDARVDELVAGLERARVAAFVPGLEFPAEERVAGFALVLDDGTRQGADIGPPWSDPAKGVGGRLVRRLGESACGLTDELLLELVSRPADELRSRRAHLVPERSVERVSLRRGADQQVFVRFETQWRPFGLELEASQAFLDLLDPLLGLRVTRWLGPGEDAALEPAVEVELSGSFGPPLSFVLGRTPAGEPACRLASGAAGLVSPELVAGVLGLFESS